MAGAAPLFDGSPATRLRVVLLVALLAVGLADLVVVRQAGPGRTLDATPATPPAVGPPAGLVPPSAPPSSAAPSSALPTAAPPPVGPAAGDAADVAFVRRYYALLPQDPEAAFRLLGPAARTQSGGVARYTAFYGGIAALSIDPTPTVIAPATVSAVIRFRRRTGEVTHERYQLVVTTAPDGRRFLGSYRRR